MAVGVEQINFSILDSKILCLHLRFFTRHKLPIFAVHGKDVLGRPGMFGGVFSLKQAQVSV